MAEASVSFTLRSPAGKHDVKKIKRTLDELPGVRSVSVGDGSKHVCVDFDATGVQTSRIRKQLEKAGYDIDIQ